MIFNARAESVLEKKMFRESVQRRRLIIPAAGFYNKFGNEDRFVTLTTGANDSMVDVHERMPLLLKHQELEEWIRDDRRLEEFLHSEPHGLKRKMEYEQQTLF